MTQPSILVLNKINKSYKQGESANHVLREVNFHLNSGEVVALVGPSGSGKSTFLQITGLLDNASGGSIIIDGQDCSKLDDAKQTQIRLHKIGFVYQFHHLLPEFTILENLIIPQLLASRPRPLAEDTANGILERLGLANKHHRLPTELSGGEQQRVAFARALINNPLLLLADEPTGNLDHANSLLVFAMMLEQARHSGVAAVIVTHNLEIAAKCDKIYTIENGVLSHYSKGS